MPHTNLKIHLKPVYHREPPTIILKLDEEELYSGELRHDRVFSCDDDMTIATHDITLEFLNKKDSDYVNGMDKAVIVDKVSFFGIDSSNVLLESTYKPVYSSAYKQTLLSNNAPIVDTLTACNYMGWNGVWKLTFSVPVFSWLHKVGNLGWLTTYKT